MLRQVECGRRGLCLCLWVGRVVVEVGLVGRLVVSGFGIGRFGIGSPVATIGRLVEKSFERVGSMIVVGQVERVS